MLLLYYSDTLLYSYTPGTAVDANGGGTFIPLPQRVGEYVIIKNYSADHINFISLFLSLCLYLLALREDFQWIASPMKALLSLCHRA